MNKTQAGKVLEIYGNPKIQGKKTTLVFARQTNEDIKEIENLNNCELINQWKDLYWITYVYGQVSLSDMQRIDLLELEMDNRDMPWLEKELNYWCKHISKLHEESYEL